MSVTVTSLATRTPSVIRESALTSASLCESLASNRTSLKVGPIRKQGAYHGRIVTFPTAVACGEEYAVRNAIHARNILVGSDGYDVTILADGVSLAVISRKPE